MRRLIKLRESATVSLVALTGTEDKGPALNGRPPVAVIMSPRHHVKHSLHQSSLLPLSVSHRKTGKSAVPWRAKNAKFTETSWSQL